MRSMGLIEALTYATKAMRTDRASSYKARAAIRRLEQAIETRHRCNSAWGKTFRAKMAKAETQEPASPQTRKE